MKKKKPKYYYYEGLTNVQLHLPHQHKLVPPPLGDTTEPGQSAWFCGVRIHKN